MPSATAGRRSSVRTFGALPYTFTNAGGVGSWTNSVRRAAHTPWVFANVPTATHRERIILVKPTNGRNSMKNYLAVTGLLAGSLFGMQAQAAERAGAEQDAWIDGKLEAVYALNRYLKAFEIDTEVTQGIVHLTGKVHSDIDRDLAGELAKGIEGVVEVDNDLGVVASTAGAAPADGPNRSFGAWIDDATTTASVKSKLVGNPNTKGLQIDVDTRGDVVTLSGEVASAEEKSLAEELTRNTGDVKTVRNQLVVKKAI